jgi:hypothetical protein
MAARIRAVQPDGGGVMVAGPEQTADISAFTVA